MIEFTYNEPDNLTDLIKLVEENGNSAALLAGGTDLINHIRVGKRIPNKVINIKNVKELHDEIRFGPDGMTLGALTTLSAIERHSRVHEQFTAISEAVNKIGSTQIRNRGTIVGNVCNASPAADAVPALLIFNAEVNIIGKQGRRSVPLETFVKGPGKTDLQQGEIVESIFVPYPPPRSGSCYLKSSRRDGADLTIVGAAALISAEGDVRIGLGAVAPIPYRAYAAEEILSTSAATPENMEKALEEAVKQANPITDLRSTREYRLAMIKVFTRKALAASGNRIHQ